MTEGGGEAEALSAFPDLEPFGMDDHLLDGLPADWDTTTIFDPLGAKTSEPSTPTEAMRQLLEYLRAETRALDDEDALHVIDSPPPESALRRLLMVSSVKSQILEAARRVRAARAMGAPASVFDMDILSLARGLSRNDHRLIWARAGPGGVAATEAVVTVIDEASQLYTRPEKRRKVGLYRASENYFRSSYNPKQMLGYSWGGCN